MPFFVVILIYNGHRSIVVKLITTHIFSHRIIILLIFRLMFTESKNILDKVCECLMRFIYHVCINICEV